MALAEQIDSPSQPLDARLDQLRQRYIDHHPQSAASFELSAAYMPGGNTRTVLFNHPFPLRIESGAGSRITDVDGIEYVNLLGEYTAGLFGHNDPVIRQALDGALDRGVNLSGHNPDEISFAQAVCDRYASIDKVRFTNSGTEANLMAISTARYLTGRNKVMVFNGGYHGGLLYFGGGGMPLNAPFDYLVGEYNDVDQTASLFDTHVDDIACVLVEPMQGSAGCIPGDREFLESLSARCSELGTVLIFDEVMTSRLSRGGAQELLGIYPDMTTLGKYLGGGMSFGAFGGSEEMMAIFDPRRADAIPHAGTFNNNSLTMAAGVAAMTEVLTDEKLSRLNARGDALQQRLNAMMMEYNLSIQFTGAGSLIGMHGKKGRVRNTADLQNSDDRIKELLFLELLEKGFYMARRGFMALMLTVTDDEINQFEQAMKQIVEDNLAVLR